MAADPAAGVRIDTEKIPPWTAEYLIECLYDSVRTFFGNPENQAGFEKWQAERAAREQNEGRNA